MIGEKKGLLTVIEFSHIGTNRTNFWKCKCECGKYRIISIGEWNRGRSPVPSCGCYKPFTDLSGKMFNMLKVIKLEYKEKSKGHWLCECQCGNNKIICGDSLTRGLTKSCGCLVKRKSIDIRSKVKERLQSRIQISATGCWEWQGPKDKDGYGINGVAYPDQRAHRSSYIAFKGEIQSGLFICHTCDNTSCINPYHLYSGTPKDNARDALERGLFPIGPNPKKAVRGGRNRHAKLDDDKVRYIRFLCDKGYKKSEISKFFYINKTQIQRIARRASWSHI
jgi:HNH endonuclease